MQEKKCCFIGHRETPCTPELKGKLKSVIKELIGQKSVTVFLFGSKSRFDDLCLETVTELKKEYPDVKRIYVRAVYPEISERYERYLLTLYDETYMPERIDNAGRASYVERNREMIDRSNVMVCYYDKNYALNSLRKRKSGTKLAYEYAEKKGVEIVNLADGKNTKEPRRKQ